MLALLARGAPEADGALDPRSVMRLEAKDRELLQLKDWLFAEKQQSERVQRQHAELLERMASGEVAGRATDSALAQAEADLAACKEQLSLSQAEVAELKALCHRNRMKADMEGRLRLKQEHANQEMQRQKQELAVMLLQEKQEDQMQLLLFQLFHLV